MTNAKKTTILYAHLSSSPRRERSQHVEDGCKLIHVQPSPVDAR